MTLLHGAQAFMVFGHVSLAVAFALGAMYLRQDGPDRMARLWFVIAALELVQAGAELIAHFGFAT